MSRSRLSESDRQVLKDARQLVKSLDAEALALLNPGHEVTTLPIKREGHLPKTKRGGQLADYSAVEVWVDLRNELQRHNARMERVYTLYFYLKRLVNS